MIYVKDGKPESNLGSINALIQYSLNRQKALIHQMYSTNIQTLQNEATKCKADVERQLTSEINRVEGETEIEIAGLDRELRQRQNDFLAYIVEQRKNPGLIAISEIARAFMELDKASQKRRDSGRDEVLKHFPKEAREAALKITIESTQDIQSEKAAVYSNLQTRSKEFTEQYWEYGQAITDQINEVRRIFITVLRYKSAQTIKELRDKQRFTLETIDRKLNSKILKQNAAEKEKVRQLEAAAQKTLKRLITKIKSCITMTKISGSAQLTELAEQAELWELTKAAEKTLTEITAGFQIFSALLEEKVQSESRVTLETAQTGFIATMEKRWEAAEDCLTEFQGIQGKIADAALGKIDPAIYKACRKVRNLSAKFQAEITPATNESIKEASERGRIVEPTRWLRIVSGWK